MRLTGEIILNEDMLLAFTWQPMTCEAALTRQPQRIAVRMCEALGYANMDTVVVTGLQGRPNRISPPYAARHLGVTHGQNLLLKIFPHNEPNHIQLWNVTVRHSGKRRARQ
eukprot:scaffold1383_cov360-Prasinococcus_capsulatus_cf.AAC.4